MNSLAVILFLGIFQFSNPIVFKSTIPQGMIDAINQGNSKKLSQFFDDNIEINILSRYINIYSKTQAERIMFEFFKSNNPTQFKIIKENGTANSIIALGEFNSFTGNYRIFLTMKKEKGQNYIQAFNVIERTM